MFDEVAQLGCTSCQREYVLPRRFMITNGDFDFSPIPRILPCLHSLCHSCLQEQFENSSNNSIICPICHNREIIKGVYYLPIDISILKQIINSNSTELMAYCSRCYETVPSVSWCETCSSALCEFHHQDHKLSVDTSKHNFKTFKECIHSGQHIEFKLPPLPCPECPMQDCSLYCHTCLHLISTKALIENHKNHSVQDYLETLPELTKVIDSAVSRAKTSSQKVQEKINSIKRTLRYLDEREEKLTTDINKVFNSLYSSLKKREKILLEDMSDRITKQRDFLLNQLSSLGECSEECKQVLSTSDAIIKNTNMDTKENDVMYLISSAETIEYRSDLVTEQNDKILQSFKDLKPFCEFDIFDQDLYHIQGLIEKLGNVSILDYVDEEKIDLIGHPEDILASFPIQNLPHSTLDNFFFYFTVHVAEAKAIIKPIQNQFPNDLNEDILEVRLNIEARLRFKNQPKDDVKQLDGEESFIIGKINIIDKITKSLASKYKIKSYFETPLSESQNKSFLQITKDWVPLKLY